MKVIRIQKKDERNVIVLFDEGDKLILSYEVCVRNELRKDKEISRSLFDSLLVENQKYHIKQKAFILIGRRLHSSRELEIKLRQKKYDANLVSSVIEELVQSGIIDDKIFAEEFAEEKIRLKLWGNKKIESELIKRGISRQIVNQVVSDLFTEKEWLENAASLAARKLKQLRIRGYDDLILRQKLLNFLIQRGYDYDEAKNAVNSLMNSKDINL
jgi:regulatory protein